MTKSEASTVAQIAITADDGCYICAAKLIRRLISEFPDHAETFRFIYLADHPSRDDMLVPRSPR